ncbi:MAG: hypothetical protein A2934_04710 [Candidatus Sungbacteria bacterium RIFCSPLOWO2_01_FULL_47_10]|uniref:Ribulose-phosphate 3-epimerase n=1 Tax=Candidatus Sungbacteria bacterium RIFCSPLOWO2_01_FULL_47_10 TaxID=1802276 RepID=A0A1G2L117_9BACT|nr:MAG: hypothetical protein A2934_04710 [Candidatus Sungbacteria bacterium RIFCSPLOWO2_01_FULL_47_10]
MVEIIPAINSKTWDDAVSKIRKVEPYANWVHIDIADGTFTPNTLWHNSLDLVGFQTNLKLEIHMMEDDPEERIDHWFLQPVKRIIVHWEAVRDMDYIIEECRKEKVEIGIAIADLTSWTVLRQYINKIDMVQVLCVPAGVSGQGFHGHNLLKIRHLRKLCPHCTIEVDGGMTPETAGECVKMGANIVAAASYIFGSKDIKKAIEELQSIEADKHRL